MEGVNRFSDRRIWPLKAHGLWICAVNRADPRILKAQWIVARIGGFAYPYSPPPFENRENCHASPPQIFFVFEGRGGVGWGMGED